MKIASGKNHAFIRSVPMSSTSRSKPPSVRKLPLCCKEMANKVVALYSELQSHSKV